MSLLWSLFAFSNSYSHLINDSNVMFYVHSRFWLSVLSFIVSFVLQFTRRLSFSCECFFKHSISSSHSHFQSLSWTISNLTECKSDRSKAKMMLIFVSDSRWQHFARGFHQIGGVFPADILNNTMHREKLKAKFNYQLCKKVNIGMSVT